MIALSPDSAVALTGSRANTAEQILDYIDTIRPSWTSRAACHGQGHVMYPDTTPGQAKDWDAALALCDRCPVRAECADYGRHETAGVWGGEVKERSKHRRHEVLDFMRRNPGDWTATQLGARLPVQQRTVHRQLAQLLRDGLVEVHIPSTRRGPDSAGTPSTAAVYRLKDR